MMIGISRVRGPASSSRQTSRPGLLGQHQVQHDQVGQLQLGLPRPSWPSNATTTSNPSRSRLQAQYLDQRSLVLDHQDLGLGHGCVTVVSGMIVR